MIGPATSLGDLLGLLYKEGKRRLLLVTALFSGSAILALVVGMNLPKKWDAYAVLQVDNTNIIKPLMEGRAVATSAVEQTAIVTQVVLSKKTMREMLLFGGWLRPPPAPQLDPREEQRLLDKLRAAIKIDAQRDGLIRIAYHDSDQQRSFKVANKLAEIYVREATEGQERESREAFDFIDRQVKEYGDKLADAHEKVLHYYRNQDMGLPPPPAAPGTPQPRVSTDQLASLRAEEATLSAQLGRTAPLRSNNNDLRQAEERARTRTIELQGQLDRLLVTYTDEHPDVRRLKRELQAAQDEQTRAESAAQERRKASDAASALDDQVAAAARLRLENVRARIAQLTGKPIRRRTASAAVDQEIKLDPEMRGVGHDTRLSELLRQYESTRDIYQDLLKRRENARVSMMLDAERRGLTLKVQEAAEMPVIPSSLRLMHVVIIGMILAMLVPLGFLLAVVALDRRVRSPDQIVRLAKVPLLVSVGYTPARRDMSRERKRMILVALMVASVLMVYAGALVYKLKTS
jgi:polysaccharide chain length determinant protein (PEP-CTERM system associated)